VPNERLAGLIRKEKKTTRNRWCRFVRRLVQMPKSKPGQVPTLHSKLPASHYVFCWTHGDKPDTCWCSRARMRRRTALSRRMGGTVRSRPNGLHSRRGRLARITHRRERKER